MLAESNRRARLPEFIEETSILLGLQQENLEVSDLDRMLEIRSHIRTDSWGVVEAHDCNRPQVEAFLQRLAATETTPVWIVNSLSYQEAIGAVRVPMANVLPVWLEISERSGFLDLVSSDEQSWVTITWEDWTDTFVIEAGGIWASVVETKPENLCFANRNIIDVFENGKTWLENLPSLIADLEREWQLTLEPKTRGNYAFVIPCGDHVLKLLPPSDNFNHELTTMLAWNGNGAAQILRYDAERGAMLIERLRPGTELTTLYHQDRDEEATAIACALMPRLAIPLRSNSQIPTAAERAADLQNLRKRFNGSTGPFATHLVEAAESLFNDLLASQGPPHLVHADLHHENILQSERGWLAIDPHGLIAEREFEAYSWLNNPNGLSKNPDLKAITKRRLHQISDITGFDRERIRGWAIACAVLSSWWSFDGHGQANEADLVVADVLLSVDH
jgi:streptomycin 6-kinase